MTKIMHGLTTVFTLTALSMAGASMSRAEEMTSFMVSSTNTGFTHVDMGETGASHGDMTVFTATFTTDTGGTGTLTGMNFTHEPSTGDADSFMERFGQMSYDFGNSNTILVAGTASYPGQSRHFDSPQVHVVIGGTGDYIGARGQATSMMAAGDVYETRFELLN